MLLLILVGYTVFSKADENLTWKVEKKISKYGEDLKLSCLVQDCCQLSAGWGKWTLNEKFTTIFIDVKILHNDKNSKYYGGTNRRSFFLLIRNITKDDLNVAYYCTYGFQVSKKKILFKTDVFSEKKENDPVDKDSTPEKENPYLLDSESSSSTAEQMKVWFLTVIVVAFILSMTVLSVWVYLNSRATSRDPEDIMFADSGDTVVIPNSSLLQNARPDNSSANDNVLDKKPFKSQASRDESVCSHRIRTERSCSYD